MAHQHRQHFHVPRGYHSYSWGPTPDQQWGTFKFLFILASVTWLYIAWKWHQVSGTVAAKEFYILPFGLFWGLTLALVEQVITGHVARRTE